MLLKLINIVKAEDDLDSDLASPFMTFFSIIKLVPQTTFTGFDAVITMASASSRLCAQSITMNGQARKWEI